MKRLLVGLLISLTLSSIVAAQECDKIKGLVHRQDKRIKFYVIPSYYLYSLLKLDAKNGDQCFATEQDAQAAGYFQLTLTDNNIPRPTPIIADAPSRSITTTTVPKPKTTPTPSWFSEWKSMSLEAQVQRCYEAVYNVNTSIQNDKQELAIRAVGLQQCINAMLAGKDAVIFEKFSDHAIMCMFALGWTK